MKSISILLLALSTFGFSCKTKTGNVKTDLISKKVFSKIAKGRISHVELQIADTSLIDPLHKPLDGLTLIGNGASFIDSSGRQTLKPTQTILFKAAGKDSLIDILNGYLDTPQDSLRETSCIILYRHVFTLYDTTGKVDDRAYLCLDCTRFDFIKRNAYLKFLDKQDLLFPVLVKILKKSGAYLPTNGPASTIKE